MPRRKPATPQGNRGAVETRPAYQAALYDASGLGSLQNEALDPAWPPPEDLPGGRPRKRQRKVKAQSEGPHVETCIVWAHVSAETWPLARLALGAVEAALPAGGSEGPGEGFGSAAGPSQPNGQHQPQLAHHQPDSAAGLDGGTDGKRAGTLCIRVGLYDDTEDAAVGSFVAEDDDGNCVGAVRSLSICRGNRFAQLSCAIPVQHVSGSLIGCTMSLRAAPHQRSVSLLRTCTGMLRSSLRWRAPRPR